MSSFNINYFVFVKILNKGNLTIIINVTERSLIENGMLDFVEDRLKGVNSHIFNPYKCKSAKSNKTRIFLS